jgi:hypothetical protein
MKTIITIIAVVLFSCNVYAHPPIGPTKKNIICGPSDDVMNKLNQFGESSFEFFGFSSGPNDKPNDKIVLSIFRNIKTGSFSIVETHIEKVSCIIATGHGEPGKNKGPKL